jgi:aryl-alcohol dehydrogenase-like predicted oxidoreductase
MYYSLLGRDIELNMVPFLKANGLGLMTWSPLASGFLSGKYTRGNPVPTGSRRAKFDFPPINVDKGYEVVDKLKELASHYSASVPQIALAWLLSKPSVSSVLIGAHTIPQLKDNLGSSDILLSPDDLKALDALTEIQPRYPEWMQGMGYDQSVAKALGS